jgi:hypothetical protein
VSAFAAATIVTERLLLVPLRPEDADEMVDVLAIHDFTSSSAATPPPSRNCALATPR